MTAFGTRYHAFFVSLPDMVNGVVVTPLDLLVGQSRECPARFDCLLLEFILRFHRSEIE
jgi:hypothetical protein